MLKLISQVLLVVLLAMTLSACAVVGGVFKAGMAVGIIAGRTVTRTGHRPFPVQAVGVSGGFAVVYVRQGDDRNE